MPILKAMFKRGRWWSLIHAANQCLMRWPTPPNDLITTALTVAVGAVGALIGWGVGAPVYLLIGPAALVSLAGLAGLSMGISMTLRNACFVVIGLVVGEGFDRSALEAMIRWPLAFAVILLMIWVVLVVSRWMLSRYFGFSKRSALLAAAPGHLSFVLAIAAQAGEDVVRVSTTQSVRLLSLTLVVPFVALAMGVEMKGIVLPQGALMGAATLVMLLALGVGAGLVLGRLHVPAPMLIGPMIVSALGHLSALTPGVLPLWLVIPAFMVLGALIGTRFSGVSMRDLASGLAAGLAVTGVAVLLALVAAIPVAIALGVPLAHILIGFAPGGFETMIALGAVMGVVPGFVPACHMMRLFVLSVMLPLMLSRGDRHSS
jgi:membrane AbrB-like protein